MEWELSKDARPKGSSQGCTTEARGQDFVPQTITGMEGRTSQARGLLFGQGQFSGKLEVHREHTQQVVL